MTFSWKNWIFIIHFMGRGVKWPGSRDEGQLTAGQWLPLPSNKNRFMWKHCRPTAASVSKRIIYLSLHVVSSLQYRFLKNDLYFYLAVCFSCFSGPASALGDKAHIRLFNGTTCSLDPGFSLHPCNSGLSPHSSQVWPWPAGQRAPSAHWARTKGSSMPWALCLLAPSCCVLSAGFTSSCFVGVPLF